MNTYLSKPKSANSVHRLSFLLVILVSLSMVAAHANAQTDSVWNGGNGSWTDGTSWTPSGVPNGMFNVFIDDGNATNSVVDIPVNTVIVVDSLTIDAGDVVRLNNNTDLTIVTDPGRLLSGLISNDGEIQITNVGSSTNLWIPGDVVLSGFGSISLGGTSGNSRIIGGGHLTNSGNVIEGFGQVGASFLQLTNLAGGMIDANIPATSIILDPNVLGFANQGTLRASAGANLNLTSGAFDNTGGTIEALAGSTVTLTSGASITGGTLQTSGDGTIEIPNSHSVFLSNLTIAGTINLNNNANLDLIGSINNQGELIVNTTGSTTDVAVNNAVTLDGGGTVVLGGTASTSRILDPASADGVLTNVDNLIQGKGQIGVNTLKVVNQAAGIINANDSSGSITLDPIDSIAMENRGIITAFGGGSLVFATGPVDNASGLIRAENGSTVTLTANIDNATGLILAEDGSTVTLSGNASVTGGTLQSLGTGTFEVPANNNAFLTDLTIDATVNQYNNANVTLAGTIDNQGEFNVATSGSTTDLLVDQLASLNGGGTITLGGSHDTCRILDPAGADGVLTNVDNLIQGKGQIGVDALKVVNQTNGIIDANDPSGSLTLDPNDSIAMQNRGIMSASGGGSLTFANGPVDNASGLIRAEDGSTVTLTGDIDNATGLILAEDGSTVTLTGNASVTGGTLQSLGTGTFEVAANNNAFLTDLTIDATVNQYNNANVTLAGTIDNQGEFNVATSGSTTDLLVDQLASLNGGGTITLGGSHDTCRILDPAGADGVLTNVDNLIQGKGQIGVNLLKVVNQTNGIIDANDSTGSLTLDPIDGIVMENRGIMTASNGGSLVVATGPVDNATGLIRAEDGSTVTLTANIDNATGLILAEDGSTVTLSGNASVTGGTLQSLGTGTLEVAANNTASLTDLTIDATINQYNNADVTLAGTIDNRGPFDVKSTGSTTDIVVNSPVMVTGPGSVNLTAVFSRITGTGNLDLPEGSLTGIGQVLVPVSIGLDATVSPGNSTGTLTVNNDVELMGGTLATEVFGMSTGDFDLLAVNGSLDLVLAVLSVDSTGFMPLPTDTFTVANSTGLTGSFDNVANGDTLVTTDGRSRCTVNYGAGSAFDPNHVVLSNFQEVGLAPIGLTVVRGIHTAGTVGNLAASDNVDVSVLRNPLQATGIVEVQLNSVTTVAKPTRFELTLEGAAFFRSAIIQSIAFFDYDAGAFVEFDSRNASRFTDSIAVAVATGDLSRFVEDGTGGIQARILYTSPVRRQAFSISIDQVYWVIE